MEKATDFLLSENGVVTTFAVPGGGTGSVWEPSVSQGAGGTSMVTYTYKTTGGITEPTEELAPVPAGVSCSPTFSKGCRALKFVYATTTAAGEGPAEWGEYNGRLKEVTFTAYEPSSKEIKTKTVAQYVYDKQGRLRAEWNPQISPALKTVYGYDAQGHVTALALPGQQPWLVEQGTTASDTGPGRVLAVARPAATSAAVLKGEMEASAPVNTAAPTLSSTTPTVGVKISVSGNGTWSNGPLAYSYQWERCSTSGKECTAIPGAVNQAYYPVSSDEGHTLAAAVVALNANGSVSASSTATAVVAKGTPNTPLPEPPSVGTNAVITLDYSVPLSGTGVPQMTAAEVGKWGQTDVPSEATAVFPPDKPMGWPAKEYTRATIYYLDEKDRGVNASTTTGGISTTEYNANNDVIRTLSPDNRAMALAAGEKSGELSKELDSESTYNTSGSEPGVELLSTLGPKHTVELTNGTKAEARKHTVYSYNEGAPKEGGPYHLVTKTTEGAQIAGTEEAASVRTTKTGYNAQNNLGWTLRKPTSVTAESSGTTLTHRMYYEAKTGNLTETHMPAARSETEEADNLNFSFGTPGSENGQLKEPTDIAVTATGNEYVLDAGNHRAEEFNAAGGFVRAFGSETLLTPHGITIDSEGKVWVADTGHERLAEFSPTGELVKSYTMNQVWGVAAGAGSTLWLLEKNRIDKCTHWSEGFTCEYGKLIAEGSGNEQFKGPTGIAVGAEGNVYVSDTGNNRIDEYSSSGTFIRNIAARGAKEGKGEGELKEPGNLATDAAGDVWIADKGNNRVQEFGPTGTFIKAFGSVFNMGKPQGVAVDSEGSAWVADTSRNHIEVWSAVGSGYGGEETNAHDTQTIYYAAAGNPQMASCGEHPEWANLPCQVQPARQPEGSLPAIPVTTYTYNLWDEPETTKKTSGANSETTTAVYDGAGRVKTLTATATTGTALPTLTDKYSEGLGAIEEQSTTTEGKTKKIVSGYNTLGQLTSYSDASEIASAYEYDVDGRLKKLNDGRGTEAYTYSSTSGLPTELVNEYGATKLVFTGKYDGEGNLLTESYPNGMSANYTYNQVGEPTNLEYVKTTHCTENCKWFIDTVVPSIHGQWLEQTSTFSHQTYTYDGAGRLTQVQNTPAGKGCVTRLYTYDEDTNRTSLTTREPNAKGECATEGGAIEKHTYDRADRLNDAGVSYNAFGDITALPGVDAEGSPEGKELTSTYYVDNQLASQTQNGETIGYDLDPVGRTSETIATGKTVATVTSHYAGPGDAPSWTSNTSGETTRDVGGLTGVLAATQSNVEAPVLQLANLHGDVIATAYLSETATAVASKTDTSEFGVPTTSLPPKYSWLGTLEVPAELPSGVIDMGARSYVPALGRFLQPDPRPGGSANAYTYTFGDPVDTSDPSGESTMPASWSIGTSEQYADETGAPWIAEQAAIKAAEEAVAREWAEFQARAAAYQAELAAGPQYGGEEWGEEEYWEEEGGYEYASDHQGGKEGNAEAHIEPAVLYQPLGEATENDSFGQEWRRILIEYGSRCEQYGGHWQGHQCVYKHHGGGHHGGSHGGGGGALEHCAKGAVAGGVGGAAGGAAGGAMAGGAGAGPGAVAGGVAGAIGGCITGVLGG